MKRKWETQNLSYTQGDGTRKTVIITGVGEIVEAILFVTVVIGLCAIATYFGMTF